MSLPTGRRGRLLALGVTFLAAALLWSALVQPLIALYQSRAERLAERETVARHMAQLVTLRPQIEARAARLSANPPPSGIAPGSSDAVAGAALQSAMQDLAGSVGAGLTSVESLPTESAGATRRIGLKLALTAPWPTLVRFIDALGRANPPMTVADLQIHSSMLPFRTGQQGLDTVVDLYAAIGSGSGR